MGELYKFLPNLYYKRTNTYIWFVPNTRTTVKLTTYTENGGRKVFNELQWEERGLNINEERTNNLKYLDDIVLIDENSNNLQQMLEEQDVKLENNGVTIKNMEKNKK